MIIGMLPIVWTPLSAQTTFTSFDAGPHATAIACAPSNNGTGHLICAQNIGAEIGGVSWQAPPAVGGSGTAGTIDHITPVALASGQTTQNNPYCGSANDGSGNVNCIVYRKNTSISGAPTNAVGIGFYPPG